MPGFLLHLLHGELVLENIRSLKFSLHEKNRFKIGLLMPDSVRGRGKSVTHFYTAGQSDKIVEVPDLYVFMGKYKEKISDPYVLGYATHLYLDKMFFSEFFLDNVSFLDENNQYTFERDSVKNVILSKNNRLLPVKTFFSEEFLYGDYTKLNQFLLQKYRLEAPFIDAADEDYSFISEVDINNLPQLLELLQHYLEMSPVENYDLRVFSADALENALKRYAVSCTEWLNKNGVEL